jgi:hypothetical protein
VSPPRRVVFGQLVSIGATDVRDRLWAQVEGSPGGEMIIRQLRWAAPVLRFERQSLLCGGKDCQAADERLPVIYYLRQGPASCG